MNFKTLLPPNVSLGAHRVGWRKSDGTHCPPGMAGYDSASPKNCDAEIQALSDMGVDWVEHLWHGPASPFSRSALEMMFACERAGKQFRLNLGSKVGTATQNYIDALIFASAAFFNSPAYMRIGGRPVIAFFGPPATIDFTAVRTALAAVNPLFLFEGFTHAEADGAFGWVRPQANPDDFGLTRLLQFRDQAAAATGKIAVFPIFKGFNDPNPKDPTKSVWDITAPVRRLNGQGDLVQQFTAKLIPPTAQYAFLTTADDYEEGTNFLG